MHCSHILYSIFLSLSGFCFAVAHARCKALYYLLKQTYFFHSLYIIIFFLSIMNPKYYNFFKSLSIFNSLQTSNRKASNSSVSIPDAFRKRGKGNQKLKASESLASSISNLHRMVTGAQDLTKVLLTDDYFSDVNPRSMRRLMNIVYITGNIVSFF